MLSRLLGKNLGLIVALLSVVALHHKVVLAAAPSAQEITDDTNSVPDHLPPGVLIAAQREETRKTMQSQMDNIFAVADFDMTAFNDQVTQALQQDIQLNIPVERIIPRISEVGWAYYLYVVMNPYALEGCDDPILVKAINLVISSNFLEKFLPAFVSESLAYAGLSHRIMSSWILSLDTKIAFYKFLSSPNQTDKITYFLNYKQDQHVSPMICDEDFLRNLLYSLVSGCSVVHLPILKSEFAGNRYLPDILENELLMRAQGNFPRQYWKHLGTLALRNFVDEAKERKFFESICSVSASGETSLYLQSFIRELTLVLYGETSYHAFVELCDLVFKDMINSQIRVEYFNLLKLIFTSQIGEDFLNAVLNWLERTTPRELRTEFTKQIDLHTIEQLCTSCFVRYYLAQILQSNQWQHFLTSLPREPHALNDNSLHVFRKSYDSWLSSASAISPEEKSKLALPLFLALLLPTYYQTLYHKTKAAPASVEMKVPSKIISWQEPYIDGIAISPNIQERVRSGQPFWVHDMPVGYDMYFPHEDQSITKILVKVYGGFSKGKRIDYAERPREPSEFENALLENGTLIIKLNLCDLIENEDLQVVIPTEFRAKLHASINGFFRQMKKDPSAFHPDLGSLSPDLPMFLSGASFGGALVAEHACKFSSTWSGYLSFNGGLAPVEELRTFDPRENIAALNDRFFVAGNYFDNRVSLLESIRFVDDAKKYGKEHLIGVFFNPNPTNFEADDPSASGHFIPTDATDLARYVRAVLSFMNGEYHHDEKDFTAARMHLLAQAPGANLKEMFQAELFRHKNFANGQALSHDYEVHIYLALKFIDDHRTTLITDFNTDFGPHISDYEWRNGLEIDLPAFVEFAQDATGTVDWLEPSISELALETYRWFLSREDLNDVNFRKIKSFLLANLHLVKKVLADNKDVNLDAVRELSHEE